MNNINPWKPQIIKLALAQFAMHSDASKNLQKAISYIEQAGKLGAQICCLPELFRTPYFCIEEFCTTDYTEPLPGEVIPALAQAAKKAKIAVIGGSIYEQHSNGNKYNTAMVFNAEGDFLGDYRKVHIPHDPAFFEANYFTPGDQGFKVFDLGFAKVSVLICFDQWFPEAARICALQGADILFYPTAIAYNSGIEPVEGDWQNAWETVQRGHAVANSVVVAAVNRVGHESESSFWGGSFISDAFGKLLVKGDNQERLLLADIDLGHSKYTRESWRFMASRRPECYELITKK